METRGDALDENLEKKTVKMLMYEVPRGASRTRCIDDSVKFSFAWINNHENDG